MTDWRDIVEMVESFSTIYHLRHSRSPSDSSRRVETPPIPKALNPPISPFDKGKLETDSTGRDQLDVHNGYTGDLALDSTGSSDIGRDWDQIWRTS